MNAFDFDPTGGLPPDHDYCMLEQPEGTDQYGENHAFWFFDDAGQVHGYNHVDAIQHFYQLRTERNWLIFPDGRVLYNWNEAAHTGKRQAGGGCLKFTCHEPFRRWSVDFLGTMRVSSAEEMARGPGRDGHRAIVDYHIDVEMAAEPWRQGKGYKYGDTRYEQLYRHHGYLRTSEGDELTIAGTGVRTHRRGPRIMSDWFGHLWTTALFPTGRGFGIKRFAGEDGPAGMVRAAYSEAFMMERGRIYPAEVIECPHLASLQPSGEKLRIRLRSELGEADIACEILGTSWRTMHLDSRSDNPRSFCIWNETGEYVLGQTATRFSWDGESVIGQLERSALIDTLDRTGSGA